jgi:hypothetical protein
MSGVISELRVGGTSSGRLHISDQATYHLTGDLELNRLQVGTGIIRFACLPGELARSGAGRRAHLVSDARLHECGRRLTLGLDLTSSIAATSAMIACAEVQSVPSTTGRISMSERSSSARTWFLGLSPGSCPFVDGPERINENGTP